MTIIRVVVLILNPIVMIIIAANPPVQTIIAIVTSSKGYSNHRGGG